MGFDCTLHAVNEKDISQTFVGVLLSAQPPAPASPGDVGISGDLWKAAFKALKEDAPNIATSTVCQLALVFAAKRQPYHYERGFALCLWPELEDGLAAEFPKNLAASPEILFSKLVKQHPKLAGQFPITFNGNFSTGTYIPARNVRRALQWVEKTVQRFDEGDQNLFQGLILVLQHCAKNQLAYWEGTDLPLPMATMTVEGEEGRRRDRCFKWPDFGYLPVAQKGDVLICSHRLGVGNPDARTAVADFSHWPPALEWFPEHIIGAAFSESGALVTRAAEPGQVDYRPVLREVASAKAVTKTLAVSKPIRLGENGFEWVGFSGNALAAVAAFQKGATGKRYPLFQQEGVLREDKSFRAAQDNHKDHWGGEKLRVGVARTGSGAEVFLWTDSGYERVQGGFRKTFSLIAGPQWDYRAETVPGGLDSFFYLTRGLLFEAVRGGESVQHLPKVLIILALQPGPAGSILLIEGENKSGNWGKIYWPERKEFIRLTPALVPEIPRRDLRAIHWLESQQRLLFFSDKEVWFVPWEEVERLPRTKV